MKALDGYNRVKLKDLAESIDAGGTPRRSVKAYWDHGDIPWLKISDLKSVYISDSEEKITSKGLENSSAKMFPKGTVLFSIFATLGATGILDKPSTGNQAIAGIVPKKEMIDTKYLYYSLIAQRSNIVAKKTHATQDNINLSILRNHEIVLPHLEIQKKIVSLLDKMEQMRQWRKESDRLTEDYLNSLFAKMFGHKTPKNKIGEVADFVSSGSTPLGGDSTYLPEGIVFIRSQNVHMNELRLNDVAHISEDVHKQMRRTWVKNGDVLLNITGASMGRVAIYEGETDKANVNQHVCIIRVNRKRASPQYISHYLSMPNAQEEIWTVQAGASRQALNFKQVRGLKVYLPEIEEQMQFASFANSISQIRMKQAESSNEINKLFESLILTSFKGGEAC